MHTEDYRERARKIVKSWPGYRTGEMIYQTADGRVWVPIGSQDRVATESGLFGKKRGNEIWDQA